MVVLKFLESIHTDTLLTVRILLPLDIIIFPTPWVLHLAIHANMISGVRLKFKTIISVIEQGYIGSYAIEFVYIQIIES